VRGLFAALFVAGLAVAPPALVVAIFNGRVVASSGRKAGHRRDDPRDRAAPRSGA
jgi:hypothetical protein